MNTALPLTLIAAVADNQVIGYENRLPWHLPADLQHFKKLTIGKPIIMGRKTWDSLGRALPGRLNLVVTRQTALPLNGAETFNTLHDARARAEQWARAQGVNEIMLIGGGELYSQALPMAERLYLTRVHITPTGDAFFPNFSEQAWQCVKTEYHAQGDTTPAHSYEEWVRRT